MRKYKEIIRLRLANFISWLLDGRKDPPFRDLNIKDGQKLGRITGYGDNVLADFFLINLKRSDMGFEDVLDTNKKLIVPKVNTKFSTLANSIVNSSRKELRTDKRRYRAERSKQIDRSLALFIVEFAKTQGVNLNPSDVTGEKRISDLISDTSNYATALDDCADYLQTVYKRHLVAELDEFNLKSTVNQSKTSIIGLTS